MQQKLISILSIIVLLAAVSAVSFYQGYSYSETKLTASQAIQAQKNAKNLAEIVSKTEEQTRKHYERYIKVLKNSHSLPDTCKLSSDFVRMRNEAAGVSSGAK